MATKILVLLGHPQSDSFCGALAEAYGRGAAAAGREVRTLHIGDLTFEPVRRRRFEADGDPAPDIQRAREAILWAEHIVLVYPLWFGDMPALLKGFIEQVLVPGFAAEFAAAGRMPKKLLTGRSARVIVTMAMPALAYRLFYCAHSFRSLKRNILHFCGIAPVRATFIGGVDSGAEYRAPWPDRIEALGRTGR